MNVNHSTARVIGALALLALLPSWLGLMGGWVWLLDVMAHFRWQYLIVSGLVVVWATWRRQRRTLLLAVLTFLLNGMLIGRLAWHPEVSRAALTEGFTLRVVSLNLLSSNPDKQAVLDYLLASDAEVIFLMEVNQPWNAALQALRTRYPYHFEQPRADNFGVAFFSRLPWDKAGILNLGAAGIPAIEVRMQQQGRDFVLIGLHTMPPMGGRNAALRDAQLRTLADHVQQMQEPVLVVGDLNATPWSTGLRIVTKGKLGFRSLAPAWTPTWSARSVFAIPIDQALCTAPLVIARRAVGPDVGSDHRPLQISVGWSR